MRQKSVALPAQGIGKLVMSHRRQSHGCLRVLGPAKHTQCTWGELQVSLRPQPPGPPGSQERWQQLEGKRDPDELAPAERWIVLGPGQSGKQGRPTVLGVCSFMFSYFIETGALQGGSSKARQLQLSGFGGRRGCGLPLWGGGGMRVSSAAGSSSDWGQETCKWLYLSKLGDGRLGKWHSRLALCEYYEDIRQCSRFFQLWSGEGTMVTWEWELKKKGLSKRIRHKRTHK